MSIRPAVFGLSDVGRKREHNEDNFLIDEDLGLFIVADGMGGAAAGEVASSEAAKHVQKYVKEHSESLVKLASDQSQINRAAAQAMVEQAVQSACFAVHRLARSDRSRRGMGCTFDCVALAGPCVVVGHVGDSRVYLLRDGKAHRLTEDHTLVALQVKAGVLTKEQAAVSEWRSVLTQAVGVQESVPVDTLALDWVPGDILLLCSDGLHNYLQDDEIPGLFTGVSLGDMPKKLVDLANERGGADNITAVVLSFVLAKEQADVPQEKVEDAGKMMEILSKISIFEDFNYKEQAIVLAVATAHKYQPGQYVVKEGARDDDLHVVVRGKLSVEKNGIIVSELPSGGHFGEMSLVSNSPRSASVKALEPTSVLTINRAHIMSVMRKHPRLAVKLLWGFVHTLSERLRDATADIAQARQELGRGREEGPFISYE